MEYFTHYDFSYCKNHYRLKIKNKIRNIILKNNKQSKKTEELINIYLYNRIFNMCMNNYKVLFYICRYNYLRMDLVEMLNPRKIYNYSECSKYFYEHGNKFTEIYLWLKKNGCIYSPSLPYFDNYSEQGPYLTAEPATRMPIL